MAKATKNRWVGLSHGQIDHHPRNLPETSAEKDQIEKTNTQCGKKQLGYLNRNIKSVNQEAKTGKIRL